MDASTVPDGSRLADDAVPQRALQLEGDDPGPRVRHHEVPEEDVVVTGASAPDLPPGEDQNDFTDHSLEDDSGDDK